MSPKKLALSIVLIASAVLCATYYWVFMGPYCYFGSRFNTGDCFLDSRTGAIFQVIQQHSEPQQGCQYTISVIDPGPIGKNYTNSRYLSFEPRTRFKILRRQVQYSQIFLDNDLLAQNTVCQLP